MPQEFNQFSLKAKKIFIKNFYPSYTVVSLAIGGNYFKIYAEREKLP
jgi:hypothetical protein